jgi:hypothetical protein
MVLLLIAMLVGGLSQVPESTLTDRFDVVEVNHVHDRFGFPLFDQLIFRNWHRRTHYHHVEYWVMIKHPRKFTAQGQVAFDRRVEKMASLLSLMQAIDMRAATKYKGDYVRGRMHPKKFGDRYVVRFKEGEWTREIHARTLNETWTQYDAEVSDRKRLREEDRRGLRSTHYNVSLNSFEAE